MLSDLAKNIDLQRFKGVWDNVVLAQEVVSHVLYTSKFLH